MEITKNYLVKPIEIPRNENDFYEGMDPRYAHQFPVFNFMTIESMLLDPRVQYGLWIIKGPISTYTKFFSQEDAKKPEIMGAIVEQNYVFSYQVKTDNKDTEDFILRQLRRFWEVGLAKALSAIEWGYSGSQVMYKLDDKGVLHFDNLMRYKPANVRPVSKCGGLIGLVRNNPNQYIPIPKSFWHIHGREHNHYTGRSRLKGPHVPWHELWAMGGARDVRRLWYFKNSYDGGIMRYPEGSQQDELGITLRNIDIAADILAKKQTGGFLILSNKKDPEGKDYAWSYEPPASNVTPDGLLEYPKDLKKEILEGLGIPPEVIESQGSQGLGSASGRKVPYMAFIASLYPLVSSLLGDFQSQILDYLILLKYRKAVEYQIEPIIPISSDGNPGNNQGFNSQE